MSTDLDEQARALVGVRLGLEFRGPRRHAPGQAIGRASRAAGTRSEEHFLGRLERLPDESPEWRALASELTVSETYFFREKPCLDVLEQRILPAIVAERRALGNLDLRLWSAGCSTGEEAYSLAILLDRLLPDRADWKLTILATDVDVDALEKARGGVYGMWSFRTMPRRIRDRYFRPSGQRFELEARIKELVTFAPLNLATHTYPSVATNTTVFDVILCRNVLMYFTREVQQDVLGRLERALVPGGWLALGFTETSVVPPGSLVATDLSPGVFFCATLRPDSLPLLPEGAEGTLVTAPPASGRPRSAGFHLALPTLRQEARAAADRGSLAEAERLCCAALALDPSDPYSHLLLGAIRQERGDLDTALDAVRGAVFLAPDSASGHFLLGSLLLRKGKRVQALRRMETVVRLLHDVPPERLVPGTDGLTAGRLAAAAASFLEAA
jgi:chemotaxis protein methyltransferase CheR